MEELLTTVLLADDHTMFREGLAELLTSYGGLEVVGETTKRRFQNLLHKRLKQMRAQPSVSKASWMSARRS